MKKIFKHFFIMTTGLLLLTSCNDNTSTAKDVPGEDEFQWQIDQFDDIRIMRYQVPEWE